MSNPDLQSKQSRKKQNSSRTTRIAMSAVLVAFVAFVGFATFSICNITSTVEDNIISDYNGVPEQWSSISEVEKVNVDVVSKIINNNYIEYIVKLKNMDSDHSVNFTNVASFLSKNEKNGFISLANGSFEYSYSDGDAKSWNSMAISDPGNSFDASKLASDIYIGKAGTATDTVFFRFVVSPSDDGTVNNKISVLISSDTGKQEMISASNTIDFYKPDATRLAAEQKVRENPTIAKADPNDESGQYTKPLGVESDPSSNIISTSSLGSIILPIEMFTNNTIIISVAIGAFAISLVVYLFVRNSRKKPSKK